MNFLLPSLNDLVSCPRVFRHAEPAAASLRIEQDRVVFTVEEVWQVHQTERIIPHDFVSEILPLKHGIEQHLEIVTGCWVAMEVEAPGWLQEPVHLQEPHGHHDEVGLHAGAVGHARRVNHRVDGWALFRNLPVPGQVHIVERPGVLERRSGSITTDRRAVGLVRVKRRVEVDQIHTRAVHAAHDVEVVPRPHRAVHPVRTTHRRGVALGLC